MFITLPEKIIKIGWSMLRFPLAFALVAATVALPAVEPGISLPSALSHSEITQTKSSRLPLLQRLIKEGKWSEVAQHVKKGAQNRDISLHDLQMLSLSFPQSEFFSAVAATKSILSIREETGLSLGTVFPIALFAQTSMQREINKGKRFWNSSRFGRELQYDAASKKIFIHLGTHGVKPVGFGRMKVVTKTILYDVNNPVVMARAVGQSRCKRERYAMEHLTNLPHVLQAQALMRHKDPKTGNRVSTIVTPIIRPGSFQTILDNKSMHLTLKEKVGIACDIMHGIAGMHRKGFAHCDLGARNYFVSIKGRKPEHRRINAYVADFGRTIPVHYAKDAPVQGNSRYMPPEAIFRAKMKGDMYLSSDLFAVGCVFWRMYFGELPAWSVSRSLNDESRDNKERYRAKVFFINAVRHSVEEKHKSARRKNHKPPLKEGFLDIILKMTNPSPKERGTAEELLQSLCVLAGRDIPEEFKPKEKKESKKHKTQKTNSNLHQKQERSRKK
jgi:serine/threonine protein kinase